MTTPKTTETDEHLRTRVLLHAARHYFGGWRALLVLAAVVLVAVIGFSWSWLVAAGIAPILLTALPCLVMCGFGLCMCKLVGSK